MIFQDSGNPLLPHDMVKDQIMHFNLWQPPNYSAEPNWDKFQNIPKCLI